MTANHIFILLAAIACYASANAKTLLNEEDLTLHQDKPFEVSLSLADESKPLADCQKIHADIDAIRGSINMCESYDIEEYMKRKLICDTIYEQLNIYEYGYTQAELMDPYHKRDHFVDVKFDLPSDLEEKLDIRINGASNLSGYDIKVQAASLDIKASRSEIDSDTYSQFIFGLTYFSPKTDYLLKVFDDGLARIYGRSHSCDILAGKGQITAPMEFTISLLPYLPESKKNLYWKLYQDLREMLFHPSWTEDERRILVGTIIAQRLEQEQIDPLNYYKAVSEDENLNYKIFNDASSMLSDLNPEIVMKKNLMIKGTFQ